MTGTKYVEALRDIRDRIGREVQNESWDAWRQRIREEVSRHSGLARMQARAVKPAQPPRPAPAPSQKGAVEASSP